MTTLAAALAAVAPGWPHVALVAGPPADGGWVGVDELVTGPGLDRCVEVLLAGEACGARDVAGSYLSSWLAEALAGPAATAFRRDGRVWSLDARDLAVRPHESGWFDGLAVLRGEVVPVDAGAFADAVVGLLEPVFAAVRARLPYGLSGMWGSLADCLAAGEDDAGDGLVDALAARAPRLRARPRHQLVAWSGGVHRTTVRGTCCLWYKVYEGGDPDPAGEGYCIACPLRTDGSRAERTAAWLEAGEEV